MNTVAGIDELRSISSEGISQVLVTFVLEKNIDVASQEVRDRIARIIPDLPEEVDAPIIEARSRCRAYFEHRPRGRQAGARDHRVCRQGVAAAA